MQLTFPWTGVEKIREELHSAKTIFPLYKRKTGKGFWLVGDQGVYLMHNTKDGIHHKKLKKDDKRLVVYADECNPDKMEFDAWWEAKRNSFGGDDGVEFIDLDSVENLAANAPSPKAKPIALVIDITPEQSRYEMLWRLV